MKILHSAVVSPRRCGLYETVRDLAAAEIALGHDARIVDPVADHEDRGVPTTGGNDFLTQCDVIACHSGMSEAMRKSGKPHVHVRHGRPLASFLTERQKKDKLYTFLRKTRDEAGLLATVTFWPEHSAYWQILMGRPVHVVPPPVDLEAWTPEGPRGYKFGGRKGKVNVVVTDVWRHDIDPFHVVNAFAVYATMEPGAKLHLYGVPKKDTAIGALLEPLQTLDALGEVHGWIISGLDHVYRAADALITPHRIATRTMREALACGCQVVADEHCPWTPFRADIENPAGFARQIMTAVAEYRSNPEGRRGANRAVAENEFDAALSAREFINVVEGLLKERSNGDH
jgi:glycosyltransferase involved in cell wall biosynthesis